MAAPDELVCIFETTVESGSEGNCMCIYEEMIS